MRGVHWVIELTPKFEVGDVVEFVSSIFREEAPIELRQGVVQEYSISNNTLHHQCNCSKVNHS